MAKITISRLFEVSKYLTTDAGKELKDALVYLSEFVEVMTRNLRKGLTFEDNFNTLSKDAKVRNGLETVVLTNERKRVTEISVRRVVSDQYYIVTSFGWKYRASGDLVIMAEFKDLDGNTPAVSTDVNIALIIHFG